MSLEIKENEKLIYNAYGVSESYMDDIAQRMADICSEAAVIKAPSGFIAKKVREMFSVDDLEIITTMFIIKVINERNEAEEEDEECNCAGCRMARGEHVDDDQIMEDIKQMVADKYPGMEAMVVKVPKEPKGRTNC